VPGVCASADWRATKSGKGAGGAVRTTTERSLRRGGRVPVPALPTMLRCAGAMAATDATGAVAMRCGSTRCAIRATGVASTNAVRGTATTAPGTRRFEYTCVSAPVLLYLLVRSRSFSAALVRFSRKK
jgi:hypothetical protein